MCFVDLLKACGCFPCGDLWEVLQDNVAVDHSVSVQPERELGSHFRYMLDSAKASLCHFSVHYLYRHKVSISVTQDLMRPTWLH